MTKRKITPVHAGFYLKELLDELKISQHQLARNIGVSPMRVNHILKEKRPVTAEMAIRLGLFFNQSPQYWLNLQSRYDMDTALDAVGDRLAHQITPLKLAA